MSDVVELLTIGVYGSTEESFFRVLVENGVDAFCDVRYRRGLRGSKYAYANHKRLALRLEELGIPYFHFKELAPPPEIRDLQKAADRASGEAKRSRGVLGSEFIRAYSGQHLEGFASEQVLDALDGAARPVFFCVEREPAACHRSLLVERISKESGLPVRHLVP